MAVREERGEVRRFGPFVLDIHDNELRRKGLRVRLQPQTLRLLLLLTASPSEILTREQLRQNLWEKDVFVEFEQALNFTVSQLRSALGDSAAKPRYIETIPRRGYRFIEPVEIETVKIETVASLEPAAVPGTNGTVIEKETPEPALLKPRSELEPGGGVAVAVADSTGSGYPSARPSGLLKVSFARIRLVPVWTLRLLRVSRDAGSPRQRSSTRLDCCAAVS